MRGRLGNKLLGGGLSEFWRMTVEESDDGGVSDDGRVSDSGLR
jgi:hypothetical protein